MEPHQKETKGLGMPWEAQYGYAQALKIDDTVWLAGQVGHDAHGAVASDMIAQMRQAYANIAQPQGLAKKRTGNEPDESELFSRRRSVRKR